MSRRSLATVIAAFLQIALFLAAAFLPLPYVVMQPGSTVDVLSTAGGEERIQVRGHKTWYDDGELRMTTVLTTGPESEISLFDALRGWLSDEEAVRPHRDLYPDDPSADEEDQEGALQMATSQDDAIQVALVELGYDVPKVPVVVDVETGLPADGKLEVGDEILSVDGRRTRTAASVGRAVSAAGVGTPVTVRVRRHFHETELRLTPREVKGEPRVGVTVGEDWLFPFDVSIAVDQSIGGPSAGLIFSLAVYDTLTPGSLTGGHVIAGTGTIDPSGAVGPIGGIQQKIVAARDAGAELFLVPADNCDEAVDAQNGDMRLVKVTTMSQARTTIERWVADPDAELPSCEEG